MARVCDEVLEERIAYQYAAFLLFEVRESIVLWEGIQLVWQLMYFRIMEPYWSLLHFSRTVRKTQVSGRVYFAQRGPISHYLPPGLPL